MSTLIASNVRCDGYSTHHIHLLEGLCCVNDRASINGHLRPHNRRRCQYNVFSPSPLPPSRNEMSAEWPRTSRSIITRDSYTSIFHAAAATFRVWLRSRYILTLARGYYLRRMKNVRVKSCIWREVMWSEKVKRTFGNTLRSLEHLGDKCWQSSLTESSDRSQWGLSVYVRQVQGVSLYLSIKVVQVIEAL